MWYLALGPQEIFQQEKETIMKIHIRLGVFITIFTSLIFNPVAWATDDEPYENSAEHKALIEESKKEMGLLIYSNIAEYNWVPILEEFVKKYPWMKSRVETMDSGPSASFERYYSEVFVKRRTADMIVAGSPGSWLRFYDKGEVEPYSSPMGDAIPEWSKPLPGLYTISTDPMIIIYNKLLLKEGERPDELQDFVEWSKDAKFVNKVTSYNAASHSFGLAIHWNLDKFLGDKSDGLVGALGQITRLEGGGSVMADKVIAGEYLAGYFVSGITIFPHMDQPLRGKIMGWSLIKDGTPLFIRGMGLTRQASSPASAKLLLNFILSHDGQVAVGQGGLTPYRDDVKQGEVPFVTYADIVDEIGVENIIPVGYDRRIIKETEPFLKKWKKFYRIAD